MNSGMNWQQRRHAMQLLAVAELHIEGAHIGTTIFDPPSPSCHLRDTCFLLTDLIIPTSSVEYQSQQQ
jgi:hypothetical protein